MRSARWRSRAAERASCAGIRPRALGENLVPGRNHPVLVQRLSEALENLQKVTSDAEEVDLNTGALAWLRTGRSTI